MSPAGPMSAFDWAVLFGTLGAIVGIGLYRERGGQGAQLYLRGGRDLKGWAVGLSIMATQASAITFLSLPGQAYEDGMGFVQFYFGLPVAMVLLCAVALPIFRRLDVTTAYEYLEVRFDRRTRQLVALLFLLSRGLASGLALYAPAIVLSTVLGWPLRAVIVVLGGVVVLYTVSGGTRIVSRTQTYQMAVILGGMAAAALFLWMQLPAGLSLDRAARLAGALGHMKLVDFSTRLDARYTIWSGLTGGLFVQLAYFGTDQSQVQRYLAGASLTESRLGLLMNGLLKVPMQALILFVGVLLFVFHQFHEPPVYFNPTAWQRVERGAQAEEARSLEAAWSRAFAAKKERAEALARELASGDARAADDAKAALREAAAQSDAIRRRAKALVASVEPKSQGKDADYIFLGFVVGHFPPGLVGLLLAVILSAAMSAVAAALNSLGATAVVDFYRPFVGSSPGEPRELWAARLATLFWGGVAVLFAIFAAQLENLIQAVNILGSIFYGPMLGIFVVGFFFRRVRAAPAFWATVLAQAAVLAVFALSSIGFLWYNVIGCTVLVAAAVLLDKLAGP